MQSFKALFEIIEDNNCPLYDLSERFELSDKVLQVPEGRKVCLILVREMTQILFTLLGDTEGQYSEKVFTCSGCTGLIKFQKINHEQDFAESLVQQKQLLDTLMVQKFGVKVQSDLFQIMPPGLLKKAFKSFSKQSYRQGQTIIQKGDINHLIYMVLAGSVSIEDGPVTITTLGKGEVFGEMSYLGSSVASTTVKSVGETDVLTIAGEDFGKLLERSSSVQMYMARLLAERLSEANSARAKDFDSCMTGRLNEMVPAELFQIFHMHAKTGVLTLNFTSGAASVSFREGCIINANHAGLENQDAIFAILAEREGVYSFTSGLSPQEMKAAEIGDFMGLLMEGVKRIDEEIQQ